MITSIECSIRKTLPKLPWCTITDTHNTTFRAVKGIYERMREISVHGRCITPSQRGPVPSLSPLIEEGIAYLVAKKPWVYQDEIRDFIDNCYGVSVHRTTISRVLAKMKITHKKLHETAAQRDPELRDHW